MHENIEICLGWTAMKKYKPTDATTNPSLIFAASSMPAYQSLIDDAVTWAKEQGGLVLYNVIVIVCHIYRNNLFFCFVFLLF